MTSPDRMAWPRPQQGQEVVPASPATGAGRFNPYRGADVHGVASPDVWQDVQAPDTATAVVPVYVEPEYQEPVPVRIVETAARELRQRNVGQSPVKANGEVTTIIGRNESRKTVRIRNIGTVVVFLVNDRSGAAFNGYPIAVGAVEELTDESAVYMVNDGTATTGLVAFIDFNTVAEA